jgi:hypothetical protein
MGFQLARVRAELCTLVRRVRTKNLANLTGQEHNRRIEGTAAGMT